VFASFPKNNNGKFLVCAYKSQHLHTMLDEKNKSQIFQNCDDFTLQRPGEEWTDCGHRGNLVATTSQGKLGANKFYKLVMYSLARRNEMGAAL